jgi:high-affinity nickel permease
MLGLDDRIVALSDGSSLWIVVVVAVLLGLRHASDPDHLAAVTTRPGVPVSWVSRGGWDTP